MVSVHPWTALPALMACLDECLAAAIPHAQQRFGVGPGADPYRGLYVGDDMVAQLVSESLADGPFGESAGLSWPDLQPSPGYERLDAFESAVTVLALAPEIDLKYERIYGYLQDDITARRPCVSLALDLFCSNLQARLAARDRFSADAPLRVQRIVSLGGTDEQPLLARSIRLDPQIVRHLVGGTGLDERLAGQCRLIVPEPLAVPVPLDTAALDPLRRLADQARSGASVRAVLSSEDLPALRGVVEQLAGELELPMLRLTDPEPRLLPILAAESSLLGYAVHVEVTASVRIAGLDALASAGSLVLVTTDRPEGEFDGLGFDIVPITRPDAALRRDWWQRSTPELSESDLDRLAARYRLTGTQIAHAAERARHAARTAGEDQRRALSFAELSASARRQSAHRLDALATRIPVLSSWDNLVLPTSALTPLHELCDRVTHRQMVLRQWGLDQRTNGRIGVNALFAGPSGTGKTMAAQVIANELGLELFAIDLSGVVSKYIGETEKNLDAIFQAAENTDAVLLFDEADALFGKRSEVRDSHDRYANLEVSYLLQRMENHDGLALLATNLRQNLDEAFLRRLAFTIRFPFPEEAERRRIWESVWPATVPLAADIDLDLLASRYRLSGGNIRNVAICAAFLAAARGRGVTLVDVLDGVEREYDKLGGGAPSSPAPPLRLAGIR